MQLMNTVPKGEIFPISEANANPKPQKIITGYLK